MQSPGCDFIHMHNKKKKTSYNQLNLNEAKVHDVWMKAGRD